MSRSASHVLPNVAGSPAQLGLFPRAGDPASVAEVRAAVRDVAEGTPDRLRPGLARSFCARAMHRYWELRHVRRGRILRPFADGTRPIRSSAEPAAVALADLAGTLPTDQAAYLVGSAYAAILPQEVRAQQGIFYTPPALVERLLDQAAAAGVNWATAQVLDPACGGGAFLGPVASRMCDALSQCDRRVVVRNIATRLRGIEIDGFAAWLSHVFLEATLYERLGGTKLDMSPCLAVMDALSRPEPGSFDLVIGNPPYGRVGLTAAQREVFRRGLFGHANLYGVFLDLAVRKAKPGGVIAYVTPTSFLGGEYFKNLRALLSAEANPVSLDLVQERSGVFDGVLQETLLSVLRRGEKQRSPVLHLVEAQEQSLKCENVGEVPLPACAQASWILPRTRAAVALAGRLRSMPTRLKDWGYRVSTGPLVWNRFKDQLRSRPGPDAIPLIWAESIGTDGTFGFRATRRNHAPYFVPTKEDSWLLVRHPCVLMQRTTSKEQPRRLIAAELPISFLAQHPAVTIENHINMLVTHQGAPSVPPATLAAFVNSSAADQAFRCLSGSVAVSAYELEALPLPPVHAAQRLTTLLDSGASRAEIELVCAELYAEHE